MTGTSKPKILEQSQSDPLTASDPAPENSAKDKSNMPEEAPGPFKAEQAEYPEAASLLKQAPLVAAKQTQPGRSEAPSDQAKETVKKPAKKAVAKK